MIARCQSLPRAVAEEMLQVVARSICDRPGDNAAQRESRTRQMVHSTLGFEPRDGLEFMLSTLVFGHYNMILDAMREVFQGQTGPAKTKSRSSVLALNRSMLALVKELRVAGSRPLAQPNEEPVAAATPPADTRAEPSGSGEQVTQPEEIGLGTVAEEAGPVHVDRERAEDVAMVAHPAGASASVGEKDEAKLVERMAAFKAAMVAAAAAESVARARAHDIAKPAPTGGD
jgi:hypothetical protein